jgi:transposase
MQAEPRSKALFVLVGKRGHTMKVLTWDGTGGLGVPCYRLEQHIEDQGVPLDRGTMSRYVDEAGGALGASIVHAMGQDALTTGAVISTDATDAMIQP